MSCYQTMVIENSKRIGGQTVFFVPHGEQETAIKIIELLKITDPSARISLTKPLVLDRIFNKDGVIEDMSTIEGLSLNDILDSGNPSLDGVNTLWHLWSSLRTDGFGFTVDKLLEFGNPVNEHGWTIAHTMASTGHEFSLDDLIRLGNPATPIYNETIAHMMAYQGYVFNFDEIEKLGNPPDFRKKTLAHISVQHGQRFSKEQIDKLGNPQDEQGYSLEDYVRMYDKEQK